MNDRVTGYKTRNTKHISTTKEHKRQRGEEGENVRKQCGRREKMKHKKKLIHNKEDMK